MGAVANAVSLLRDMDFRDYVMAVCVYTARTVLAEDPGTANHAEREALARKVLQSTNYITDKMVSAIATDPEVASLGTTVGDEGVISETMLINKAASYWTGLSLLDAAL